MEPTGDRVPGLWLVSLSDQLLDGDTDGGPRGVPRDDPRPESAWPPA